MDASNPWPLETRDGARIAFLDVMVDPRVISLAGLGYLLADIRRHPTTDGVLRAVVFLFIPLTLAWWIDRRLRARSLDAYGL